MMQEELIEATTLPNGCCLYYKNNGAGGRTYYSDELGQVVLDTCLVDLTTLLITIAFEQTLVEKEKRELQNRRPS